jgi:hypothetical protein
MLSKEYRIIELQFKTIDELDLTLYYDEENDD